MRPISLYIHIPFCTRTCPYCTFFHVPHDEDLERRFVPCLVREITTELERLKLCPPPGGLTRNPDRVFLRTIYFGGGTPSLLSRHSIRAIFEAFSPFIVPEKLEETTFELNPEDVTRESLVFLREMGVTRASLGVQSMSAGAQRILRRCPPEANERALSLVKSLFADFNLDVLLGIPGTAAGEAVRSVETLVETADPTHLSVYCLEGSGIVSPETHEFLKTVDQEQAAEDYLAVCGALRSRGYEHYEVSNFSRPGFESKHNFAYWNGDEYLGLGPGAHSFLEGERFYTLPSLERYLLTEGSDVRSAQEIDAADTQARILERLFLGLRTGKGLPLDSVRCDPAVIKGLIEQDLARIRDRNIVLSDAGFLVLDEIVLRLSEEKQGSVARKKP